MAASPWPMIRTAEQARALGIPAVRAPAPGQSAVIYPGRPDHMPPPPDEGVGMYWGCEAQRVQLAGGMLNAELLHPSTLPFERLYRRLPDEGMFDPSVSPETPFVFELGAFTVPSTFALLLFDLRPDIYRFSGIDPGDFVPLEARRFASIMGFELTVDQKHMGNIEYQIDPISIQFASLQAFTDKTVLRPPGTPGTVGAPTGTPGAPFVPGTAGLGATVTPQSVFNISAASSFSNTAGAGLSLLPQRPTRYGALDAPFTLIVHRGQTIQIRCIIFRPIPSPIAFIEFDMAGFMVPEQWLEEMLRCVKPSMDQMHPR